MNTTTRWAGRALAAALASGALLAASPARADGSDLLKKTDKVGPMMANLRIGPAFAISSYGTGGAGFTLAPEFGYAVALENNLYVVVAPQFTLGGGGGAVITIPVGAEYDFPIAPVPNLYVTGRFLAGYSNFTGGGASAFTIIPEVGAKFIFKGRFNVGLEPFSMPIHFASATVAMYRINLHGGINF